MKKKALIIVESPAKIKTLKKFLGDDFAFESSMGHIRDLPAKEFGIDIEHDFAPTYVTVEGKEALVSKLKKAAKECETVYLSPDPDREGEAIAWHIRELLPPKTLCKRVSFNSITKEAVTEALRHPRDVDMALVNAQQARRLLDRMVGYKISPLINRRMQRGKNSSVSAGRVQSVALKLIVDREKAIAAFQPTEYWNLAAWLQTDEQTKPFKAILHSVDGQRVEKEPKEGAFTIPNKTYADDILVRLKKGPFTVAHVERKEKRRNPVPPFITSTLQQEASRHFGFGATFTMSIAQGLYEGIDLGKEGTEGVITYMRTDSVRIAPEALAQARSFVLREHGPQFLPEQPRQFSTAKAAQDAHEAIRPTHVEHTPEMIQPFLSKEQFLLYQLIWRRFVSSQMAPAIYDTVSADIHADQGLTLRATGSQLKFAGFLAIYEEKVDDETEEESKLLPDITIGQKLALVDTLCEQAFTRPPPRFTEASLVKELEKSGIGRPSTYASIMNKIQGRDYTIKESGRLKPTELGVVLAELLEANFPKILDVGFTAAMEDELELVAENKKAWNTLLADFWRDFAPTLETAAKEAYIPKVTTELLCPKCHAPLQKIWAKSKYFYGCSLYPECDYSASLEELSFDKSAYAENFDWEQPCPKCQGPTKLRHGRFGPFLGCLRYPECKGIINIPKKGEEIPVDQGPPSPCPAIDCPGTLTQRRSRYGKPFFSCSTYPECDVIGNSLEQITEKYLDHPRTPYVKVAKAKRPSKKAAVAKKPTTKRAPSKKKTGS